MKMKSIITLIAVILLAGVFQIEANAQVVTWQKWFDYNTYDSEATDAIETLDGGYLVLTNNYATPEYSIVLIKLNSSGNVEWQKLLDQSVVGFELSCFSVSQSTDSSFVLSGYGNNAVLVKTNNRGELLWAKTYSLPGHQRRFWDHQSTSDGGVIAVGDIYPPTRGCIVKTDSQGNIVWDSIYTNNLIRSKIIESNIDKNFYFTNRDHVVKIDSIGRRIWSIAIKYAGGDIIQTKPGDIYTASGSNAFYLNKIDTSGKLIWQKSYFPDWACSGLCLGKDGNLLLAGFSQEFKIVVLKTDLKGNQIFGREIHSFNGNYFVMPRNVNPTSDNGYIFSGITDFPNTAQLRDNAFVAKTDSVCYAPKLVNVQNASNEIPSLFELSQNYPNPFNSQTKITYKLIVPGNASLDLFDINGKKINLLNKFQAEGSYSLVLDADKFKLSSGIYLVRLSFKNSFFNYSDTKKIILLK